ncbi:hypothetical protein P5673_025006 [Acropora cervicornis]|uniref:Uncharacterized protein n=1 Tax=Acropora cervicornis TaxID=6130 RepID=A0AAD9Q362_ACRCE|nr:hypothetical protein P5673_025006 [Acropora cervicornis]
MVQESIRSPKKTTTKRKPNASSAFNPLGMRHVIIRTVFVCKTFNDIEQDPASAVQCRNGYLFEQRMTQRRVEQAGPSYLVQEPPNFPCFPVGGHFPFLPSGRPCSPAESTSSCGSLPSESTEAKSKRCSWSNPEVKCLISAYK